MLSFSLALPLSLPGEWWPGTPTGGPSQAHDLAQAPAILGISRVKHLKVYFIYVSGKD